MTRILETENQETNITHKLSQLPTHETLHLIPSKRSSKSSDSKQKENHQFPSRTSNVETRSMNKQTKAKYCTLLLVQVLRNVSSDFEWRKVETKTPRISAIARIVQNWTSAHWQLLALLKNCNTSFIKMNSLGEIVKNIFRKMKAKESVNDCF